MNYAQYSKFVGSAEFMAKFLETQNQLLAVQVQPASLPPPVRFDRNTDTVVGAFRGESQVDRGDKVVPTTAAPHQAG